MAPGTGGARVMIHALRALAKHDSENQYIPYYDNLGRFGSRGGSVRAMSIALAADLLGKNCWLPFWSRHQKLDALLYFLPPCSFTERQVPQFCYIHDVPEPSESRTLSEKIYNRFYIPRSCACASHIITVSQFSADRINRSFGIPLDRISVVYSCIDLEAYKPQGNLATTQAEFASKGIQPGFILGVLSRMQERKNPRAYLETYYRLPEAIKQKHKLVVVGAPTNLDAFKPFVDARVLRGVAEHVIVLGRVSDQTLNCLYQSARVLFFPSKYEGFGLPVVEGLASGIDVVTSNIPPIREIASDSTFLFDADDWNGMARCLEQVLASPNLNEKRRQIGLEWVQKFSYLNFAQRLSSLWSSKL